MKTYDFVIIGGGCSGLATALQLLRRVDKAASILIVDRDKKQTNDRTWAFWTQEDLPLELDKIVSHRWTELAFRGPTYERQLNIAPYTYQYIKGLDYYQYCHQLLGQYPSVEFQYANIKATHADASGPYVWVNQEKVRGQWIFDSRPQYVSATERQNGQYFLWQHFRGWVIETEQDTFQPDCATLMDFSYNPGNSTAFFYLLPSSERKALVEFTLFDQQLRSPAFYDNAITDYLRQRGINNYQVLETETGKIPMTNVPLTRPQHERIIPIGSANGAVKPTTGYAFLRIQYQAKALATTLAKTGELVSTSSPTNRFDWYDNLLLHLLTNYPARGSEIFCKLFEKQPFTRILQFLDQDTHVGQELLLFKDLPVPLFLRAVQERWQQASALSPKISVPSNATGYDRKLS
ncbi:MAG: lycopene cyclase family protein [Bacteroidota bacterium]